MGFVLKVGPTKTRRSSSTSKSPAERTRGADGGLYALGMPTYGGTWTFKVFFHGPSRRNGPCRMSKCARTRTRTAARSASIPAPSATPALASVTDVDGGIIVKFPAVAIPGQTYEGMIDFEEITSLVDGGTFNPPLTSSGP